MAPATAGVRAVAYDGMQPRSRRFSGGKTTISVYWVEVIVRLRHS
jgi:hypothetical protein